MILNIVIRKKLAKTPSVAGALKSMNLTPTREQVAAQQDVAKVDLGNIKTLVINKLSTDLKDSFGVMLNDTPSDTAQHRISHVI